MKRHRWRRAWSNLWSWLPWHPHYAITDAELDRRLRNMHTVMVEAMNNAYGQDIQQDRFIAMLKRQHHREETDAQVLATPLPNHPTNAEIDRWCAALLREIIRHRRFPHDPQDIYLGIEGAVRLIEAWIRGEDTSVSTMPHLHSVPTQKRD